MKLSEIKEIYGDIEISPKILRELGIEIPKFLNAKQIKKITGKEGYPILAYLKRKYHLEYKEAIISEEIFNKEYKGFL
ncbi:hypothetical protein B7939_00630 [Eggerthia catenaformis]|nr:hypothetical protein B7939_00630 [Eggerthia catenaformis]